MEEGGRNHDVKQVEPVLLVHLYTHTNLNPSKRKDSEVGSVVRFFYQKGKRETGVKYVVTSLKISGLLKGSEVGSVVAYVYFKKVIKD